MRKFEGCRVRVDHIAVAEAGDIVVMVVGLRRSFFEVVM